MQGVGTKLGRVRWTSCVHLVPATFCHSPTFAARHALHQEEGKVYNPSQSRAMSRSLFVPCDTSPERGDYAHVTRGPKAPRFTEQP